MSLGDWLQVLAIVLGFGGVLYRVGRKDKTVEDHGKRISDIESNRNLDRSQYITEKQHVLICRSRQVETKASIDGMQMAVESLKADVGKLCRNTERYQQSSNERWEETTRVLARVQAKLDPD